ncbi:succinate dehydrogenase, hydrophobic membrane anchor protein [Methylocystis sp. 9N]|uniref:Succinate dehydrogenase hydrophobic membrane anchor subunit n=1 Tax=Methylocystis borbori TaxID=3118750 RepID=A0ABU7XCQ1_9HYPH
MTIATHFKSERKGRGEAYVSDHAGSHHALFMRRTSYALAPLGVLAAWFLLGAAGKPLDGVRAEIGRPLPALVLIAFAAIGMLHARQGMNEIIEDYVHDEALKAKALAANKWIAFAVAAIWVVAILIIAAPR